MCDDILRIPIGRRQRGRIRAAQVAERLDLVIRKALLRFGRRVD